MPSKPNTKSKSGGLGGLGAGGGGGGFSMASKLPGIGQLSGMLKKLLGVAVVYIIIDLAAGGAMKIADIVIWIKNGISNDKSPTGKQCYYSYDRYPDEIRFSLSGSGQNVTGAPPSSINSMGQKSQWVDTGFLTNGKPLQINVTGGWYPFGKASKKIRIKNQPNMAPKLPPDADGGANYALQADIVDMPCITTTDLSYFADTFISPTYPSGTSITGAATALKNTRQVNHLLRYSDTDNSGHGLTGIDAQMEEIMDIHCLGTDAKPTGTAIATNICSNFRPATLTSGVANTNFTPCVLANGHGVYLKIGNANYGYHLANHEVNIYQKKINRDGSYKVLQAVDDMDQPLTTLIPFSLPTQIYSNFRAWNDIVPISNLNQDLGNYAGGVAGLTIRTDNLGGRGPNGCYKTGDTINPNLINETCPPPPGQPIYAIINDTNYGDNTGEVELIFLSGATRSDGKNGFYNGSVFTSIATWIFSPWFGTGAVLGGKSIVQVCQTQYDANGNPILNSGQSCGAVITLRNMFLSNFTFQVLKILLLVVYVMFYGLGLIKGNLQINETDIAKRLMNLAFIIWATDPTNYEFIDNIVVPFFFEGFNQLAVIMVNTSLRIVDITTEIDDPFGIFDVMLAQMFSPVIGYKMLALINTNFIFLLGLPLVWILMIAITIVMIKTALSYALSVFMLGFFIVIAPLAVLMMLSEYTAQAFNTWLKTLIKEASSSVVALFFISLFFALIYKPFQMLFSFDVCWSKIFTLNILNIIKINEYGWLIPNSPSTGNYFLSILLFTVSTFLLLQFKNEFVSIGDKLFGGGSSLTSPKQGEAVLDTALGSLTGMGTKGTGISAGGGISSTVGKLPYVNRLGAPLKTAHDVGKKTFNDPNPASSLAKGMWNFDALGKASSFASNKMKNNRVKKLEKTLGNDKYGLGKKEVGTIMQGLKKGNVKEGEINQFIKSFDKKK